MKIGYLTGQYPRATDTFIQREISFLRHHGLDVQTFSVRKPSAEQLVGPEQQSEFEQTYYLIPPNVLRILGAHLFFLLTNLGQYYAGLKLALKTSQPAFRGLIFQLFYFLEAGLLAYEVRRRDIQHLHNHIADSSCTVAMLAAKISGISFSFTIHGPYIFYEPYRWCLGEKIRQALFVACISNFCRSQCMLFSPIDCWSKLHIVHCGIDSQLFSARTHAGQGAKLLYVGRLAPAKGLPILLDSLAELKSKTDLSLTLTVIGDGCERSVLEQKIFELGLASNVNFVGYQSQTEVRRYLQQSDIFVLPSFAEGVPVSLMEAMASGVPVISTQIAGISELVANGKSGFLVAPGDVLGLAAKIEQLAQQPELRQSFGQVGHDFVKHEFNIRSEAKWLVEIMETSLLKGAIAPIRPSKPCQEC